MQDYTKFKSLLEEKYQFPCDYNFKFVVPSTQRHEVADLFKDEKINEKTSKTGKYTSFRVCRSVTSSEEIVDSYRSCENIKNLIML